MDHVILWELARGCGKYLVSDVGGQVLLGPFYSHPDPDVFAVRLAKTMNRPVRHLLASGDRLEPPPEPPA